ncbi:alpha-L-arabinofuranosidase-like protein [Alicyclobacillus hesperidum URH17-3-68]|nr:alpha-L-arabinofuranosidase-like protein [Alicyclobacillus hesperidum URH17-3-68]
MQASVWKVVYLLEPAPLWVFRLTTFFDGIFGWMILTQLLMLIVTWCRHGGALLPMPHIWHWHVRACALSPKMSMAFIVMLVAKA